MKKQTLRPLTPQEQAVAAQNHDLVFRFLQAHGLPQSEYYDVVIFRYLLTVENWFRRPELYRYQFSTIAWRAMSSALYNEQKKKTPANQDRQPRRYYPGKRRPYLGRGRYGEKSGIHTLYGGELNENYV